MAEGVAAEHEFGSQQAELAVGEADPVGTVSVLGQSDEFAGEGLVDEVSLCIS